MSDRAPPAGIAFVLSAPSGAGKTTLADVLLGRVEGLKRTISWTTRQPRGGERDGVDYTFVERQSFERLRDEGGFLEWADVHGQLYATPVSELERIRAAGEDALMVIDVQGAEQIRKKLDDAVTIFVLPPSPAVLRDRLKNRDGRDPAAHLAIDTRLGNATEEISRFLMYDYLVINDDLKAAVEELRAIVVCERCRRERRQDEGDSVLRAFQASLRESD